MKNEDYINKLIRDGLKVENVPEQFTDQIMQRVYQSESIKEKALRSVVQKYTIEKPSKNFSVKVMNKIHQSLYKSAYQPVISKKGWLIILIINVSVLIFTFLSSESNGNIKLVDKFISGLDFVLVFHVPKIITSSIFALSIFALCSLLFLDYFIRNKKEKNLRIV